MHTLESIMSRNIFIFFRTVEHESITMIRRLEQAIRHNFSLYRNVDDLPKSPLTHDRQMDRPQLSDVDFIGLLLTLYSKYNDDKLPLQSRWLLIYLLRTSLSICHI